MQSISSSLALDDTSAAARTRFSSSTSLVRAGKNFSTSKNGPSCSTMRWMVVLPTLMGSGMGRFLSGVGRLATANGSAAAISRLGDVCNPPPARERDRQLRAIPSSADALGRRLCHSSEATLLRTRGFRHCRALRGEPMLRDQCRGMEEQAWAPGSSSCRRRPRPARSPARWRRPASSWCCARDGAELEAALGPAEYMVCYPNVTMRRRLLSRRARS